MSRLGITVNYAGGDGNDVVVTYTGVGGSDSVAGRHIFYNQSAYDGNNAGVNAAGDEAARATDKTPYIANGAEALYTNITSYSRGINGIMVDLSAGVDHSGINASDFVFKTGTNNTPSSWATTAASTISVIPGGGVGGSDRVEILFPANTIRNQWLEVQVLPTAHTGTGRSGRVLLGQQGCRLGHRPGRG